MSYLNVESGINLMCYGAAGNCRYTNSPTAGTFFVEHAQGFIVFGLAVALVVAVILRLRRPASDYQPAPNALPQQPY